MARYYGGLFYRSDLFNYILIETYCMKNNCTITDLQSRFNKETFKYSPFLNDYSKEISIFQYCFVIWLLIWDFRKFNGNIIHIFTSKMYTFLLVCNGIRNQI